MSILVLSSLAALLAGCEVITLVFMLYWRFHVAYCLHWIYSWQESYPYCEQMSFRYLASDHQLVVLIATSVILIAVATFGFLAHSSSSDFV